jgi:hypothetical protein
VGEYAPAPDRLTSSDGNADVGEDMSDLNEENRRLLAALIQRVPELEARQERPGASEMPGEGSVMAEPRPTTGGPPDGSDRPRDTAEFPVGGSLTRPWWRRVFGG